MFYPIELLEKKSLKMLANNVCAVVDDEVLLIRSGSILSERNRQVVTLDEDG